ncbi:SMI1/KNR4 family protein [Microbulbifer sp. OS29]|uniref:SMI1/KNR4 family protein n=1 Tax=Microbulbifer okhotskensis TaxID=2926617 RepID=A0A9X2J6V5_9GAMM|nr:SMI1/KNR4 family protein [Microbulbifer okhotskensis]MCO1337047.1 SMI1/KNR4 family protein [Microbulbifer okhotskensis]
MNDSDIENRLFKIKQQIKKLSTLDKDCSLFGTERWRYDFRRFSEPEISRIEQQYSIRLPPEFRAFLLEVGFGAANSYGANEEGFPYYYQDGEDEYPMSVGTIDIAEVGCGIEFLLVVNGLHRGEVWVTQSYREPQPFSSSYLNWYEDWLAKSLKRLEAH